MSNDPYTALWVSHSSMSDFLKCPRSYYLKNVYKDPKTRHKIQVVSPPLALGQAVHEVIESLAILPTSSRFDRPLLERFEQSWKKVHGKMGGFFDESTEQTYKERGLAMIRRVQANPGPLKNLAVRMKEELPHFWLSEDDNIILCGKIDWIEYLKEADSVHIIDFKTSRNEEDAASLQLPIYYLLVHYCQQRKVSKMSYWYLDHSDTCEEKELPDIAESYEKITKIAKQIKLARQLERLSCPHGEQGCYACRPFEAVLRGEAEKVGVGEWGQDLYVLQQKREETQQESEIL